MTTSNFSPLVHNLVLIRGDTVDIPFRFGTGEYDEETCVWTLTEGYDLTGVVFAAQMWINRNTEKIVDFIIELDDQTDPETRGKFYLRQTAEVMEELPIVKGKWDLEATWPGGRVKTYLAGSCDIAKDYTREDDGSE